MTIGTYGLTQPMTRVPTAGNGLVGLADAKGQQALSLARQAAENENQLEIRKKKHEQERKAGNAQLGSAVGSLAGMYIGAQYGSAGGPWGAAIGGIAGGLLGGAF